MARLVGVMTRTRFAFQPGEGYFSRDRYAVTLAPPLANGAASSDGCMEHAVVVLVVL